MARAVLDEADFSELKQALADLPLADGEGAFSRVAGRFLKEHGDRFRISRRPEPLTPGEAEALAAVDALPDATTPDAAPLLQAATSHAALVATALPTRDVARRLGVTEGRLRQRIGEGSLLAVRAPDERRLLIPVFQLTPSGELPGLRTVLKAIRPEVKPLQIAAFFTTPQPDLEGPDGDPMTPVDWLLAGNDPEEARVLARGL